MRKLVALPALAVVALLLVSACGGNGASTPTPTPAVTPMLTPAPTVTPRPPPLTTPAPEPTPIQTPEEILSRSNEARGYEESFGVTNVKIEREEDREGQPVWVISYEAGSIGGVDSEVSVWRMEWIAKGGYVLLHQEELYHDSFGGHEEYHVSEFSDPGGESGGAGADAFATGGLLFNGTISGVPVSTITAWEETASPPQTDCDMDGANPQPVSLTETVGTPLNIKPTYLPAGTIEWPRELSDPEDPPAVVCGGQVSRAKRLYRTPPSENQEVQDSGGWISIEKWRGPNFYVGNMLAAYVSVGEVNDKPAIFVRRSEIVAFKSEDATFWATEGRVIIPEEFGFTVVRITGPNLPFEEAVKIAEGLE